MTRLLAISDVHVGHGKNLEALASIAPSPPDWLIVAGDVGERLKQLDRVFDLLTARFAKVIWVPGNHELWTLDKDGARGEARYKRLVDCCREHGVLCPEDPYPILPIDDIPTVLAPLFLLYDYTFAPDDVGPEGAVAWARQEGIVCTDEHYLHPDPHPSRAAWCAHRLAITRARLDAVPKTHRTVLVNHFPLRRDLVRLYEIPRFIPWCGSRETEDWHTRYRARAVVSGHLHMRATDWRDGVQFDEVALGYPRHWTQDKGIDAYVRQILPSPLPAPESGQGGPIWHR